MFSNKVYIFTKKYSLFSVDYAFNVFVQSLMSISFGLFKRRTVIINNVSC